ncbi:MAG: DUF2812 domain-containing protein [Eubacteriales bacterium]|nr:DUF2812 domain-containing protein [Eubacteriales bacterium]
MEKTVRKTKFYMSLMKEKLWLEDMAQQGYFLKNMNLGCVYTFSEGEPRRLVYDIDRFDLPKSPTLNEIREKENFVSLAGEMGWQEVTHDEDLNYYFCKPYEEGGINEIYDTPEARKIHALKYRDHYLKNAGEISRSIIYFDVFMILLAVLARSTTPLAVGFVWSGIMSLFVYFIERVARMYENDLRMGCEEWLRACGREKDTKKEYHLFLTTAGLTKYLHRQSRDGWHIIRTGAVSYSFEKGDGKELYYAVDSKAAVNKRRRKRCQRKISDGKDINQQNHDWQVASVHEAEQAGLEFVCAYACNQILYRSSARTDFGKRNRFLYSWMICWCIFILACACLGFLTGYMTA